MASDITNQSRNVLSKKLMIREEDGLDNINLFSIITIISFTLLVHTAILTEGIMFTPAYQQYTTNQRLILKDLCLKAIVSGICFHSYQQMYSELARCYAPSATRCSRCKSVRYWDLGEGKCIESILRNPRRQAFIMVRDCEDVPYHRFVAKELGCINRKNPNFDGYIQTILMSSKPEELADATAHLGQVMTGGVKATYLLAIAFLEIIRFSSNGGILNCGQHLEMTPAFGKDQGRKKC